MTTLLATGYLHLGVPVDLYGTSDSDGIEVEDVKIAGNPTSLIEWFSNADLRRIEDALERKAVLEAAQRRKENRIDRAYLAMHA